MSDSLEPLGVVGAGLMGAEIALVHALAGHPVLLNDRSMEILDRAKERLVGILRKGTVRGLLDPHTSGAALHRISFSVDLQDFRDLAIVVEAVFEDETLKTGVLRDLDAICNERCLFATNTSTIPISTLASSLSIARRPHFAGMHYFSPVWRMQLVEIVAGFDTADETIARLTRLAIAAGKTPIRVKDVAGFAVNRMVHAFLIEAITLVDEGVATAEQIDLACRLGLGHPIGPFEMMDSVSSTLTLQVQEILHASYGERFRPPQLLKQMVRAGRTGRKAGAGWHLQEVNDKIADETQDALSLTITGAGRERA